MNDALQFLRLLSERFPPTMGAQGPLRHALMVQDGRLMVVINSDGRFDSYFLDSDDIEQTPTRIVAALATFRAANPPPPQPEPHACTP